MSEIEAAIEQLTKRVARAEWLATKALERARAASNKVKDLINNQKHYLRHRAPGVLKRQARLLLTAERFAKRYDKMPRMKFTQLRKSSRPKHVLMVDGNQAKKLVALADLDFRSIINALPKKAKMANSMGYSMGKR